MHRDATNVCLVQWQEVLDEARADDQAQGRARERWLRRQAEESATLVGTLLDLAESGVDVALSTLGGRRHDGPIVGLGIDVVVLEDRNERVAVRLPAITTVRPRPGAALVVAAGDRAAVLDLTFVELLARFVDERPDVSVALLSGEAVTGRLVGVGTDVLSIRVAEGEAGIAYCSAAAASSARLAG